MNFAETHAGTRTYVGVFGVTLVTLMYEILLTQIFSVTMYYHFAFMAISITMFGMTVGGIAVYLHPACSQCVCLALTKFPRQVSRIYAVDLAGAATGCVFLI
jgi:hypothetical protein